MKIKGKLLLLSLLGILWATSYINKNDISGSNSSYQDINIDDDTNDNNNSLENDKEVISSYVEETINAKDEVMNLIDSGLIKKVYYATNDVNLDIPDYLSESGMAETVLLPKLECLEVYDETEDKLLVKTNEYIGYVSSTNLEELLGTFVVVDISNQELKLYSDNEVILTTPVVTGKPSSPSDQGIFEIYNISGPRYLVGPNYKSFVDVMMKYNGGEGLHDAEYHQNDDGFKHGWREKSEFGGETYLTDGSHGCVNMMHDDVMYVKEHVKVGTKVLVKQ